MKAGWFLAILLMILFPSLAWFLPDLRSKVNAENLDKQVSLAVDWEDVVVFGVDLKSAWFSSVVFSPTNSKTDEDLIRKNGMHIVWRLDDDIHPDEWLARFQNGDGVFIAGEHVLEHPRLIRELPSRIQNQNGFLCLMEFVPNPLLPSLARRVPRNLIKSHLLGTREMLTPAPAIWEKRLVRAVVERWARLLVVRFCPAWTLEQNIEFQKKISASLTRRGFVITPPAMFREWNVSSKIPNRLNLVLLISVLTPVLLLAWSAKSTWKPAPIFLSASLVTVIAGLVIHGMGSTPETVLGIQAMRGVKLQLALPLLLAGGVLFSLDEWKNVLDFNFRIKHLLFAVLGLVVVLGIYLMRSGNFPIVPVSDSERVFRNWLDAAFIARPRFKECFIGHPLFLMGLFLKERGTDDHLIARILLWAGLIGQISILNTFTHFHSPLNLGLIRTVNGILAGFVVASPALILLHSRK